MTTRPLSNSSATDASVQDALAAKAAGTALPRQEALARQQLLARQEMLARQGTMKPEGAEKASANHITINGTFYRIDPAHSSGTTHDEENAAASNCAATLAQAIENRTARIGVIGLGYVGLPLIRAFIQAGFNTIGYDVDKRKVDLLRSGQSYIDHVSSQWISECVSQDQFAPTADMSRLSEADVLLICVPTPLTDSRDPDLSFVEQTTRMIALALRPGQLVVLESTTYPTTTRNVVLPILEHSGLKLGQEFFLAFSPEREDPGNPQFTAASIPKVVGGVEPQSKHLATLLYSQAIESVVPVSSAEVAEACKVLENTYRAVNISLINELKVLFHRMGIDVWEVIEAAKTKPFGFQPFYPGPGLGGHCIPIDPFYLTWLARKFNMTTRFIELAGEVNALMPQFVVDRVAEALNAHRKSVNGSRIAILGIAYKRDVDDSRESPAFRVMELLLERGAELSYHDPHVARLPSTRHYPHIPAMDSQPLTAKYLASQDIVVVVTDHTAVDYAHVVRHAPLVIDTRNATRGAAEGRDKIYKA